MGALKRLHSEIDGRVNTIRAHHPEWLCGKGCDHCCRQLADVPRLTADEWELLRAGLAVLPRERLEDIRRELAAMPPRPAAPIVCPLLDHLTGSCPVYAQRPVPCRTYGFYVQRDLGLYCSRIEALVADGALSDVIWGNQDGVDHKLLGLGPMRALGEWFELWATEEQA